MQGLGARLCCYWSAAGYALALMPALAVKQQTRYRFANSSLESDPAHSIKSGPELRCIVIKPPCVQGATCFELELVQQAAQGPHSESILEEDQQDHCEEDPVGSEEDGGSTVCRHGPSRQLRLLPTPPDARNEASHSSGMIATPRSGALR